MWNRSYNLSRKVILWRLLLPQKFLLCNNLFWTNLDCFVTSAHFLAFSKLNIFKTCLNLFSLFFFQKMRKKIAINWNSFKICIVMKLFVKPVLIPKKSIIITGREMWLKIKWKQLLKLFSNFSFLKYSLQLAAQQLYIWGWV